MNDQQSLLMIFVKNPEKGKVKTRLAATIGEDNAFKVYEDLLQFTHHVVNKVLVKKQVHYSKFIDENDLWETQNFEKVLQSAGELGKRMQGAFAHAFKSGYKKIVIIGSDCPELTPKILKHAFMALEKSDTVIGPASDGGYYLLGMNAYFPFLFENKKWSTSSVFKDTIQDIRAHQLTYKILPTLSDIDREEDLVKFKSFSEKLYKEQDI
ncbi:TIGR04282 family arsenosugar biosynthesis glycosyltransferase [Flexithrix dorotheae]|uniref:TIGR04282 family arsenosugar biosynthesis glycosyltransferase n=1 Tax=Flexithrix dorotheae TaxID=70993 RepID=UPI0005C7423C|nr:TIGR04282 family arsenosugar biosynthesis glycosyltransferase [Flexithrix dorotheae]